MHTDRHTDTSTTEWSRYNEVEHSGGFHTMTLGPSRAALAGRGDDAVSRGDITPNVASFTCVILYFVALV